MCHGQSVTTASQSPRKPKMDQMDGHLVGFQVALPWLFHKFSNHLHSNLAFCYWLKNTVYNILKSICYPHIGRNLFTICLKYLYKCNAHKAYSVTIYCCCCVVYEKWDQQSTGQNFKPNIFIVQFRVCAWRLYCLFIRIFVLIDNLCVYKGSVLKNNVKWVWEVL